VLQVHLNGHIVGDDVLAPGWTSYHHRLRYRTYDVSDLILDGANTLGVQLADGWYRGYLGFAGLRDVYGDRTGALVQLEIDHPDGSRTVLGTDRTWRSTLGPITRADLYRGETFDARRELPGWDTNGFDDSRWDPVDVLPLRRDRLVAPTGPPVRRTQTLRPLEITTSAAGATLVDFGQNLVGRLQLDLPEAAAGTTITVRHAEVLEHGELGTRPLRAAAQTDTVILDRAGARTWEPVFTVHGFRYVQVDGWPGELTVDDLRAVVIHTDLRRTGTFSCSDPLLSRLHENVVWGMRGNFVDVPTDCPQRDERLGWTGDLQVFAPTASFLFDTAGMLAGWLADLAVDQHPDGVVPPYVPWADIDPNLPPLGAEAGWGDAATVLPGTLYQRYGDAGILRGQWDSMTRWVDAFAARAGSDLDSRSATGSTHPRPTTSRGARVFRGSWWRPATWPGPPGSSPTRPRCSAVTTPACATRHWPTAPPTGSDPSTSPPTGGWRSPRRPPTRWRWPSTCSRIGCGAGPAICWPNRSRSTISASAPVSWVPRCSVTRWPTPGTPPPRGACCCNAGNRPGCIR